MPPFEEYILIAFYVAAEKNDTVIDKNSVDIALLNRYNIMNKKPLEEPQ